MKRSVLVISLLLVIFIGANILKMNNVKSKNAEKKNILKAPLYFDISTFHFCASNKGSYINSSQVIPYVFEGLMRRGEDDIPMPAIASKVDVSEDQKTYTFYLRETMWSDGTPLTAYDFEYAWKSLITPNYKSITVLPELFYPIKNAEKYLFGNCSSEEVGIIAAVLKKEFFNKLIPPQRLLV